MQDYKFFSVVAIKNLLRCGKYLNNKCRLYKAFVNDLIYFALYCR